MIRILSMPSGFDMNRFDKYKNAFKGTKERDYVVFNSGHWFDSNRIGDDWPSEYKRILNEALQMDFGKIPDRHVFFRTTSVRHFLRGYGDWNTESSKAGASGPEPRAQRSWYGGNAPVLPLQNFVAMDIMLGPQHHHDT